jgi:hypothetical protein
VNELDEGVHEVVRLHRSQLRCFFVFLFFPFSISRYLQDNTRYVLEAVPGQLR